MNAPSKDKMRKLLADRPAPILKDGSKEVDIFCALKFMDEIHLARGNRNTLA